MPLSAEQFADRLAELAESGWVELEAGELASVEPPDEAHGNIVLNFSKALGTYLAERRAQPPGYACFDLGLIVARRPDTVRRPAVSFFTGGLFDRTDELVTAAVPELVVEVAATPQRRRSLKARVESYHRHGVAHVWVADPLDRSLHVCTRGEQTRQAPEPTSFRGDPVLPGFEVAVAELFAEPAWWRGG